MDSKRIQPSYAVGDRLTVLDSVNKESECVVLDVAVKENQLKLLIHYVGWTDKWNEWIAVNSKRIVQRLKGDKGGEGGAAAAAGEASGSSRPVRCSFELIGKQAEVVKVDASMSSLQQHLSSNRRGAAGAGAAAGDEATGAGAAGQQASQSQAQSANGLQLSDDDSPLVLVRVSESSLSLSVLLWMKLSLLRLPSPRSHQPVTHHPLLPAPSSSLTCSRASFAAMGVELDGLIFLSSANAALCIADTAKRCLQLHIASSLPSLQPPLRLRDCISLLASPPADALRSVLSYASASSSHQLMAADRRQPRQAGDADRGRDSVTQLVAVVKAAMDREMDRARDAKSLPSHAAQAASPATSQLIGRSLSTAAAATSRAGAGSSSAAAGSPSSLFDSWAAELHRLLSELSPSLLSLSASLRSFSLTSVTPSSPCMEIRSEHPEVSLQLVSLLPVSEAELKGEKAAAASASSAAAVSSAAASSSLSSSVWSVQFHSDEPRTVLLHEIIVTADPPTRLFPPFLVSNPVFVSASLIRGRQPQQQTAKTPSSGRLRDASDCSLVAAITPFTTHSLETLYCCVDFLCGLRRAYSPLQQMQSAAPLPALAVSHVRRLESLLRLCYQCLTEHLVRLHRVLPLPSNLKARGYEQAAKLLACLTFSHLQLNALIKRERERDKEHADRERERERERERDRPLLPLSRRKQGAAAEEERKEREPQDDHRHRDDHHAAQHPPPHPSPLVRAASSSSSPTSSPSSPSSSSSSASSLPGLPSPSSFQSEQVDLSWLSRVVLHEARQRHAREKAFSPLQSVYLQRMVELLLAGLRYEKLVVNSRYWDSKAQLPNLTGSSGKLKQQQQQQDRDDAGRLLEVLRSPVSSELPVVLSVERLLLLAADPRAHPPLLARDSGDARDCDCQWCRLQDDARDQTTMAMPLLDLSPHSLLHSFLRDMDHLPDSIITGQLNTQAAAVVSGEGANVPTAPPLSAVFAAATSAIAGGMSTLSSMFGSGSPSSSLSQHSSSGSPASAPATLPSASSPQRSRSEEKSPSLPGDERDRERQSGLLSPSSSSTARMASAALNTGWLSTSSSAVSVASWRDRLHVAERLLPAASLRSRIFNLLLNSTAQSNHARPEIAFRRGNEHSGDDAAGSVSASSRSASSSAAADDDSLLQRQSMFQQLCDAFVKSGFHRQASALRAEVSTVSWKTILAGALDQGAAGLPGPFRQALYEICQSLNAAATNPLSLPHALFIPCPNSRSQTGDDRNKLLVNPGLSSEAALVQFRVFGQLMGVAIRSKCFTQADCRVLTDSGLLFLEQIEQRMARGERVLYACYDTDSRALVYRPGLLLHPQLDDELISFSSEDEAQWGQAGRRHRRRRRRGQRHPRLD